jgi:hypothetical protein
MSSYLNNQFITRVKKDTIQIAEGEYQHLNFVLKYGKSNVDSISFGYMVVKCKSVNGDDVILRRRLLTYDTSNVAKIKGDMLSLLQNDLFECVTGYDVFNFDNEDAEDELENIAITVSRIKWNDLVEKEEDKQRRILDMCKKVLEDKDISFDNRLRTLIMHFTAELNRIKGDGIVDSDKSVLPGSEE